MWLNSAKVILKDRVIPCARLRIENGYFAEIIEQFDSEIPQFTIVPGLIDLHGDMLERDIEPRPGARFPIELALHELDKRLAATGITLSSAAVAFAWKKSELRKQEVALEIIETIHRCAPSLLTEMRVHGRFELSNPTTVPLIYRLLDEKKLHLLSIMDHTPGQGQYADIDRYLNFMAQWVGGVSSDVVDQQILTAAKSKLVEESLAPRNWETVRQVIAAAIAHDVPVASHDDDTAEKVDIQADMGVTISEFPVTTEAAERARWHGIHIIMGAPNAYRGQSTSGNLSAAEAAQRGLVDILATDYVPASMLHAAFRLAERGVLSLPQSINLVALNPAHAMGLYDRGQIAVGMQADFIVVEEGETPRVRATFRTGKSIYSDGTVLPEALYAAAL
jgi:alpha-D-ribose 1-methylphosphonate 5-triphosphate diphosphatase